MQQELETENMRGVNRQMQRDISQLLMGWKIEWEMVELQTRIAAGAYGEVWVAKMEGIGTVAIKKLFCSKHIDITDDSEIRKLLCVCVFVCMCDNKITLTLFHVASFRD